MSKDIIKINEITFTYNEDKSLIKDLSFSLKAGECLGIIGANGAGKSTLLKLILGLLELNSGEITVDGIVLNKKTIKEIRKKIGYVFQDSELQLFMPRVIDDVAFGVLNQGYSEEEAQKISEKALETVGAIHLKNRPPYELSGGEMKKVALATVLAMKPEILIFDEPSIGLDPKSRRNLINLINKMDKSSIIATHDMEMALDICDKIIVIYEGQIVLSGTAKEVFADEELLLKYDLEQPYSMKTFDK